MKRALILVYLGVSGALISAAVPGPMPDPLLTGLSWRQIGPFRGGRLAAVTGVPSQPETYYLGAALGGVWKTTDGGNRWTDQAGQTQADGQDVVDDRRRHTAARG